MEHRTGPRTTQAVSELILQFTALSFYSSDRVKNKEIKKEKLLFSRLE
jgi:hypothetical protein